MYIYLFPYKVRFCFWDQQFSNDDSYSVIRGVSKENWWKKALRKWCFWNCCCYLFFWLAGLRARHYVIHYAIISNTVIYRAILQVDFMVNIFTRRQKISRSKYSSRMIYSHSFRPTSRIVSIWIRWLHNTIYLVWIHCLFVCHRTSLFGTRSIVLWW